MHGVSTGPPHGRGSPPDRVLTVAVERGNMTKRALITGITGQDGSYLAEHLLGLGYQVWGLCRGRANPRKDRIAKLIPEPSFVDGDLMDQGSLVSAVDLVQPDEVYNLGRSRSSPCPGSSPSWSPR
ncbi:hypothetical protein GCM10010279_29070 [Streptomyces mutabilis]|nr:hypothetical protein GCM10010279_29070 [Streptomyces mutabilis]